jgi:hypothetical protein
LFLIFTSRTTMEIRSWAFRCGAIHLKIGPMPPTSRHDA